MEAQKTSNLPPSVSEPHTSRSREWLTLLLICLPYRKSGACNIMYKTHFRTSYCKSPPCLVLRSSGCCLMDDGDNKDTDRSSIMTYTYSLPRGLERTVYLCASTVASAKTNTATGPTYASNSELYMKCPTEHTVCWTNVMHAYRLCVTCHVAARLLQLA